MMIAQTFHAGDRVRKVRKLAGMSQADLALKAGLSQSAVSNFENSGEGLIETARAIVAALGITLDAVYGDPAAPISPTNGAANSDAASVPAAPSVLPTSPAETKGKQADSETRPSGAEPASSPTSSD